MAHTDTLTNMIDNIHVDVCFSVTALSTLHLSSSCRYKSGLLIRMTNTNNMLMKSGTISSNASATTIEWWLHTVQTGMQSQMPLYETSHGKGVGLPRFLQICTANWHLTTVPCSSISVLLKYTPVLAKQHEETENKRVRKGRTRCSVDKAYYHSHWIWTFLRMMLKPLERQILALWLC